MKLLIIIIFFYAAYFVYDRLTIKYTNPYKLFFIFGAKGAGKTMLETKLAVKYLKMGWNVYSDMPELIVPGVRLFQWKDLGDFVPEENSLLILSEVGTKFDKRNFRDFKPQLRDFFVFQRKYKVVCYMDSQSYDVDKKIRDRCDGMFLCVRANRLFTVAKRIVLKPQIIEASDEKESRIADQLCVTPFWNWYFTFIPNWCNLYDTNAIIDQKDYLKYEEIPPLPLGSGRNAKRVEKQLARAQKNRQKPKRKLSDFLPKAKVQKDSIEF